MGDVREGAMNNAMWADPSQTPPPAGALSVEPRGADSWEFDYPRLTQTIYDVFHQAIDSWNAGDVEYAEDRYRQLLSDYPEFIDVYHHLAMLLDETGRGAEAFVLWQHAVELGLGRLPEAVRSGSGTLPWLLLDNRPFLRAYHGLALQIVERGHPEQALEAFLKLLARGMVADGSLMFYVSVAAGFNAYLPSPFASGLLTLLSRYIDHGTLGSTIDSLGKRLRNESSFLMEGAETPRWRARVSFCRSR